MRCFIGAFLPSTAQKAIYDNRPELSYVRWTRPDRYHITLEFYGDLVAGEVSDKLDRVAEVSKSFPTPCRATVIDGFPNRNRARVVVVRVDSRGILESLSRDSKFQAHVTVGYARQRPLKVPVTSIEFDFCLNEVWLVESKAGQYRILTK